MGDTEWSDDHTYQSVQFVETDNQYHLKSPIYESSDLDAGSVPSAATPVGFLHLTATKEPVQQFYRTLAYVILIACAVGLVAVIPLLFFWSRRLSRPVFDLQHQLQNISFYNNESATIRIDRASTEFVDIADIINELLKRVSLTYIDLEQQINDRTEKAAVAMRDAQRSEEEKAVLITNLSHELRSPLTSVLLFIDHCREMDSLSNATMTENLEQAHRYAVKLDQEIRHLLQYSADRHRIDVKIERLQIHKMIKDSLSATQRSSEFAGNSVHHEHSGDTTVYTDRYRLKHTFENLLINAHKYCSNGVVTISTVVTDGRLTLSVTDTGDGIPVEHLDRIFEMHYQASNPRAGGLGIGLALCKIWMESLGGTISVSSNIGQPTTFRISLPVAPLKE